MQGRFRCSRGAYARSASDNAREPAAVQRRIGKVATTGVGQTSTACTCKGACTCQQLQVTSLAQAFDAGSLPGVQHAMSEKLAHRRHAQLISQYKTMAQHPDTKAAAHEHLARFFRVQHSVDTAWLNVIPTKDSWEIDDTMV